MADFGVSLKKDLTAEEFGRFRDWIHRHSGMYLEDTKLDSLRISLVSRATRFGFVDYSEYYRMLIASDDEFKELMNLVTINETSFFRFPAQFDALRDAVIPEILDQTSGLRRAFRVWSAGCSTGEEPYTIAMTLLESSIESRGYSCEVLGTDVSTHALDRARAGQYPARAFSNLSQDIILRWFEPSMGGQRPVQRVRDIVDFSYHNLVKEPYPLKLLSNWDVIFCRNVTIYFRTESTRRVVENFYQSLNPGGYLFIGHSETLSTISDRFEPLEINGVFLYRKPIARRAYALGDASETRAEEGRRSSADRAWLVAASAPAHSDGAGRAAAPPALAGSDQPGDAAAPSTQSGAEAVSPADALVGEAYALLEQGRPADARVLAERALLLAPRNIEAMLVRAYAHADAGDFSAAIAESTAALGIDPLLAPARYIQGIIYQRQGDANGALTEFKRTIYIDNDFVLAHFNAANIYRARGAMEDACREYENTLRALYLNPEGSWIVFLGGFRPDLLAKTCERSLIECRRGS